jgi:hypothetical protein
MEKSGRLEMAEEPEREDTLPPEGEPPEGGRLNERFPDLEVLQQEVEKRIRDNQRFLERFLDDEFDDEEDPEGEDETFEEL